MGRKIIYIQLICLFSILVGISKDSFASSSSFKHVSSTLPIKSVDVLENSLNPEDIFLGPGDIIDVDIISSSIVSNYDIMVDNTGIIIVPIIGPINVNGESLFNARKKIESEVKKHYTHADVNATFKKAGLFKIKLLGPFNHSVYYTVNTFNTVFDVYQVLKSEVKNTTSMMSNRNIELIRNGKSISIDLFKFSQQGDVLQNPYIRRGDVLKVAYREQHFSIWGGVHNPRSYEFVENENIAEFIQLSGGFTETANIQKIAVTSFIDGQKSTSHFSIEDLENILIKPHDIIMVHEDNYLNRQSIVNINGEVKFPGPYQVEYGITSLTDLVEQAGGYTNFADSSQIILKNKYSPKIQHAPIDKPKAYTTATDLSWAHEVWENTINEYNIVIESSQFSDYILNKGDDFTVLPILNYIDVIGAVNSPSRITYIHGENASYYIEKCSGFSKNAYNEIFIIKYGTHNRIPINKRAVIERGDVIYIPEKIEYNKWERFKDWMTVTSQIGTLIIIVQNIIQ